MVSSGVKIDDEVKEALHLVSKSKASGALFRFSKDFKKIELVKDSILPIDHEQPYEEVLTGFEDDNAKYGIALVNYRDDEKPQSKVVLIMWASDKAPLKQKMLSTSSFDALKKEVSSACITVQMNGPEQKCIDEVIQKVISVNKRPVTEFEKRKVKLVKEKNCYEYDE